MSQRAPILAEHDAPREHRFPGVRDGGSLLVTAGAPLVGTVVGAVFFDRVVKPFFPQELAAA